MSYAISLPFMLVSFVRDVWTAGLLTFLAVLTYWSTNEVRHWSTVVAFCLCAIAAAPHINFIKCEPSLDTCT